MLDISGKYNFAVLLNRRTLQ